MSMDDALELSFKFLSVIPVFLILDMHEINFRPYFSPNW